MVRKSTFQSSCLKRLALEAPRGGGGGGGAVGGAGVRFKLRSVPGRHSHEGSASE